MTIKIDPKTLTPAQVEEAVRYHGKRLGSLDYYINDEVERCKADPEGIRAFRETDESPVRAFFVPPQRRR